jgi:excisionase family DNA binding protein
MAIEFVSTGEAAQLCGVSDRTIRNWVASGQLSAERHGKSFRIPIDQVRALERPAAQVARGPRYSMPTCGDLSHDDRDIPAASYPLERILVLLRQAQLDAVRKAEDAARWRARAELLAAELSEWQARTRDLISELGRASRGESLSPVSNAPDQLLGTYQHPKHPAVCPWCHIARPANCEAAYPAAGPESVGHSEAGGTPTKCSSDV